MESFTGNRSLILLLTVLFCHLYPTKNYQKIQASGLFYQAAKKYSSCVLLPKKRVTCQAVILQMMLFCMAWKTVIKCTISNCVLTTMLSRTQKIAPITISFQFAKRAFLNGSLAKNLTNYPLESHLLIVHTILELHQPSNEWVLPAWKLLFVQTENFTLFPRIDPASLFGVFIHSKSRHFFKCPGTITRFTTVQANLLDVQSENGKLGGSEAT